MLLIITYVLVVFAFGYILFCYLFVPPLANDVVICDGRLPLIGHAGLFRNIKGLFELFNAFATDSIKEDKLSAIFLGPYPVYIITDPADVNTVLNKCLDKMLILYRMVKPLLGTQLLLAEVPVWKRNRKILDQGFKQQILEGYIEVFNKQALKLVEVLNKNVGKSNVDLREDLTKNLVDTAFQTLIGLKEEEGNLFIEKCMAAQHKVFKIITLRLSKSWMLFDFIFNLSSYKKEMDENVEIIFGISQQMINIKKAEHLQHLQHNVELNNTNLPGKCKSFLDVLIESTVDEEGSHYTDEQIKKFVNNILIASFDTTTYELLFTLICIGSYPEIQDKIYEELKSVLGKDKSVNKENISKLVYLEAVIKETLRLYPTAPMVARQADKDVKLNNVTIPSGSFLVVHIWATNRNNKYWGNDAHEFKPERWLDPNLIPRNPAAFATFSPGRRGCIGKGYVMMHLKATVAQIIQNFKITADHTKLKLECYITVKATSGHLINIERR